MPNYGKPALLSMDEVEEVLRNFGNMLQHMLSNQGKWSEMCSKAGQEWDVLDLPGFFMQNWWVKLLFLIHHWYCFFGCQSKWSSNFEDGKEVASMK